MKSPRLRMVPKCHVSFCLRSQKVAQSHTKYVKMERSVTYTILCAVASPNRSEEKTARWSFAMASSKQKRQSKRENTTKRMLKRAACRGVDDGDRQAHLCQYVEKNGRHCVQGEAKESCQSRIIAPRGPRPERRRPVRRAVPQW